MSQGKQPAAEPLDDVVDAMNASETAVATVPTGAVSTEVKVQGAQLEFPFIRIGQGMSTWKTTEGRKPQIGGLYIGKNKENNVLIADEGKEAGICGILLEVVQGFKERRQWQAGMGAPKRWIVGTPKEDGTPSTEAEVLAKAAKEGFSLQPKETGEVWPDTGRPKLVANLDRFCYVLMLVPVPDTFESDDFRLVPIGDRLYTTARFEFEKQYYKSVMSVLQNIEARAKFAHRHDKTPYQFSVNGMVVHIYSTTMTNRNGIEYVGPAFERALRDGKPWEFTTEEKSDFTQFLMSAKAGYASAEDAESTEW